MSEKKPSKHNSAIFILSGVILILVSIWWEVSAQEHEYWEKVFIHLLTHLGIGAIVIGTLGLLIDMKHWKEYFKERLKDIVMEKEYMREMSPSALKTLQTDLLKAYFNDDTITRENGFLQYYQNNIQDYIATPFRINVECDLLIEYTPESNEKIIVHEEISWYCKSNRGAIQKEITWQPDEIEFEYVTNLILKLQHESFQRNAEGKKEIQFKYENFDEKWKKPNNGFIFPLNEYINCDELKITIKVDYTISTQKFYAWRMTHPSRGLTLTIRFPKDLTIVTELYGIEDNSDESKDQNGFYKLTTPNWILTDQGMVFQLIPKKRMLPAKIE